MNEIPRIIFAPRKTLLGESVEPENQMAPASSEISGARNTMNAGTQPIRIRHILAPTDLSKDSRESVKYALWLASRYQARLTLVYIFKMPENPESSLSDGEEIQQCRDRAELRLLKFYDVIRAQYYNTEVVFRMGDPDIHIPQVAASLGVDLVVR